MTIAVFTKYENHPIQTFIYLFINLSHSFICLIYFSHLFHLFLSFIYLFVYISSWEKRNNDLTTFPINFSLVGLFFAFHRYYESHQEIISFIKRRTKLLTHNDPLFALVKYWLPTKSYHLRMSNFLSIHSDVDD